MENFGRLRSEQQQIYLNTGKLVGVQSLDISPSFGAQPLNYIGIGNKTINQILNSEQFADMSINSLLIDKDNFIQYTGKDCFNIFILQNQGDLINNYCLISGYLSSYNSRFSIGRPAEISTSIKFVNNAGKIDINSLDFNSYNQITGIPNNVYETTEPNYNIPSYGSINLILDEYNTNRVIDCSIDIKINRLPVYNIGNRFPSRIDIIYPIIVNWNFTIEISNYSGTMLQSFPRNQQIQNISLDIYDHTQTGNLISSFSFNNATLIDEKTSINTDSNTTITKSYITYLFN